MYNLNCLLNNNSGLYGGNSLASLLGGLQVQALPNGCLLLCLNPQQPQFPPLCPWNLCPPPCPPPCPPAPPEEEDWCGCKRKGKRCPKPPFITDPDPVCGCLADGKDCPKCPWLDCCAVYGGMIRSEQRDVQVTAGLRGVSLGMDAPLASKNVSFNGDNLLSVECAGTYEVTFFGNFKISRNARLTFYVKANGSRLNETVATLDARAGMAYSFERSVFVHLCAGSFLNPVVDIDWLDCGEDAEPACVALLSILGRGTHLSVHRVGSY